MKARTDKEWHYIVCSSADYVCQKCKHDYNFPCYFDSRGVNQMVCGHHRKSKKAHPELRLVVENGICVCKECHTLIHSGKPLRLWGKTPKFQGI